MIAVRSVLRIRIEDEEAAYEAARERGAAELPAAPTWRCATPTLTG